MEYILLQQYILVAAVLSSFAAQIHCVRELRPSEHGLAYEQESQTDGVSQEDMMLSFFGPAEPYGNGAVPAKPEARNISDTWLDERRPVGGGRERGDDRVRLMLIVASGVCGLTGVVLLVVSAVVCVLRTMGKQKKERAGEGEASTSAVSPTVALQMQAYAEKY